MNVNKIPVNTAANLSMFMVSASAKLTRTFRGENTHYSVIDLKSHYRGLKYIDETLKGLPQKPEPIVIEKITEHLGSIGAIHWTQIDLNWIDWISSFPSDMKMKRFMPKTLHTLEFNRV